MNVELKNIHKHFGKVHANKGINITIFLPERSREFGGKRRRKKHFDEDPFRIYSS
jgi:hypothetical protein